MFLGFYEVTISFDNREEAFALLGAQDEFLRVLAEAFSCRMVSRGDGLLISGEEKRGAAGGAAGVGAFGAVSAGRSHHAP